MSYRVSGYRVSRTSQAVSLIPDQSVGMSRGEKPQAGSLIPDQSARKSQAGSLITHWCELNIEEVSGGMRSSFDLD
eukprot:689703-Pyramimonas_sp.AAC.2